MQPALQIPPWLLRDVLATQEGDQRTRSSREPPAATAGWAEALVPLLTVARLVVSLEPAVLLSRLAGTAVAPRNPALVCRVLLRHGRVADALDLALAGLEGASAGGPRWLSAGLIDQIDAAARTAAQADRSAAGGALDVRLNQLESAVRHYLLGAG